MSIETDLKSLVEVYANYDAEKKCYTGALDKEQLSILDRSFTQLLLKWLLHDGPERVHQDANYQKLKLFFDPQVDEALIPEVLWLEQVLSQDKKEGICLHYLTESYQRLVSPEKYKNIQFNEIVTRADLKIWLESSKKQSRTYNERSLYNSMLSMLDESDGFYDEVGKIRPNGVRALMRFLPTVLIGLGTAVFIEELLAVYALYFVLLKGSGYVGASQMTELSAVGKTLQKVSEVTATTTTTLLVRLVEMIFWSSHQCYSASLYVGITLLDPLVSLYSPQTAPISLEDDLLSASKNRDKGIMFSDYQLKLIASPIESHHGILGQQYFLSLRAGKEKLCALNRILLTMQRIDQNEESRELRLVLVSELLERTKKIKEVYTEGGKTASAIDKAVEFLKFLKEHPLALDDGTKKEQLAASSSL